MYFWGKNYSTHTQMGMHPNHEIHSTTGCIPFELFHKRTDRNFNLPLSVAPITETIYSDAQYASLVEKARNGMIKKAAKSVAQ